MRIPQKTISTAKSWLALGLLLAGCGGVAAPSTPSALLISPSRDSVITVGQPVAVAGTVSGAAIRTVDIYVDDRKFATVANKNESLNQFIVNVQWTADLAGSHLVQLRGLDDKGSTVAQSENVIVTVKPATAAPTAVIVVTTVITVVAPTPSAAQATGVPPAAGTPVPGAGPTVAPTPTKAPVNQITVTNDFARVRNGPTTANKEMGQITLNQTAEVKGKSADGLWWQIVFAQGEGGLGWVFGELVQFKGDAAAVPVVKVAAPPTAVPAATTAPTAAPTIAPTAKP